MPIENISKTTPISAISSMSCDEPNNPSNFGPTITPVSRYPMMVGILSFVNMKLTNVDNAKMITISFNIPTSMVFFFMSIKTQVSGIKTQDTRHKNQDTRLKISSMYQDSR